MRSLIIYIFLLLVLVVTTKHVFAEPVHFCFTGRGDVVDDISNAFGGGDTIDAAYTFESTAPDVRGWLDFGEYQYDNLPGEFEMTETVGPYTWTTAELDPLNFSTAIYVLNNNCVITPRDSYFLLSREVMSDFGTDDNTINMGMETITSESLNVLTSTPLPLTIPDLSLSEYDKFDQFPQRLY